MGKYSKNINKLIAKKLVNNPKHAAFNKFADPKLTFWFRLGFNKLHYGRGHLEGELTLNAKGRAYYKKNSKKWE